MFYQIEASECLEIGFERENRACDRQSRAQTPKAKCHKGQSVTGPENDTLPFFIIRRADGERDN